MNVLLDFAESSLHIVKTVVVWYAKAIAATITFGWFVLHVL